MSEKIYAWLLRLYPSRFRERYGDEALQLFRDRLRDESGILQRLRLWLDLTFDLAISLPREYGRVQPARSGASSSALSSAEGMPLFQFEDNELPRPGALFFGGVLSTILFGAFAVAVTHFGNSRPLRSATIQSQPPGSASLSTFQRTAPAVFDEEEETVASVRTVPAPAEGARFDASKRQHVIDAVISTMKEHYVDPGIAKKIADAVQERANRGDYNAVTDGARFADLLTRQMREISRDPHLEVVYSPVPLRHSSSSGVTAEALARYRAAMDEQNCTVEKVEIRPHRIGYLKLNSFPDAAICRPTVLAVMASLNAADAIIFDLRDNTGGFPNSVALIAGYLFEERTYLYNPRGEKQHSWTLSPVAGNRLYDKPAYVLTSGRTGSAAEQFCYNLKMLKRATVVGETTRGSAHAGVWHRIDDHIGMGIPQTKSNNPYSNTDWEGIGVEPDIEVSAADALETAERLARRAAAFTNKSP